MFVQVSIFYFFIATSSSCQTTNKDKIILDKNKCYDLKLSDLKKTDLYNEVMIAFNDTFPILKTKKEYFGVPERVTNQIDEALFLKKDGSECMLIVLQKSTPDLIFGAARMVRGFLKNNKWHFDVSMDYYFEKDYFQLFKENNFENISKLARYSVLTDGNTKKGNCEIDDYYWFVHLKN